MPVQVSYPGVYIQEVSSGVRTITGVSTSVAVFIGMARRGPLNRPTRVLNYTEFESRFGDDTGFGEMVHQVRQFFLNGGKTAWIMRIANGAVPAQVTLRSEDGVGDVLLVTARDASELGDAIRLEVDYATSSPETTFNLTAYRRVVDGSGRVSIEDRRAFTELTMDSNGGRYAPDVINSGSSLIRVEVPDGLLTGVIGNGFARAGLLLSDVDDTARDTLNSLVDATHRRIVVSVDGERPVEVALTVEFGILSLTDALSQWESDINDRLALEGAAGRVLVTAEAGPTDSRYLQIESDGGPSVTLLRAPAEDATVVLQLGIAQGGLEISRFSRFRPAPTGNVTRLSTADASNFASHSDLARLDSFAETDKTDLDSWTFADSTDDSPYTPLPPVTFTAGQRFYNGTASSEGVGSLLNVRENLETLRASLVNVISTNWDITIEGLRLALRPRFGTSNADLAASLTTAGGGAFNLGDAAQMAEAARAANVTAYSLNSAGLGNYQAAGAGGNDGATPIVDDYNDAFVVIEDEVDLFNLMILPRADGQNDAARRVLWGPASAFCQRQRAFLLVDPPSDNDAWSAVNEIDAGIGTLRIGVTTDHAAIYWPRLRVAESGGTVHIDPAGTTAGIMARTDANRGVWKAPAGLEAITRGALGLQHMVGDAGNGITNPQAVNTLRIFPTGAVIWGARTMGGFDNSGIEDYKHVPVRRFALFIEESLYRGLKFAVFEPNDEPLWAQIRLAAGAFMNNLFRQGAFQGQKTSDAYFVKVDSETTTQNDINLGIVNVVVGFAALKPAEFIVITLQQKAGETQT